MFEKTIVLCGAVLLVVAPLAAADPAGPGGVGDKAVGGPDPFGYTFVDSNEVAGPAFDWIDISATGTDLQLNDESQTGLFPIGFDFTLYGQTYNAIDVQDNGNVTFDTAFHMGYLNECIPGPCTECAGNSPMIAGFWDDLMPGSGQPGLGAKGAREPTKVYYELQGTAPNRKAIIMWDQVPHYNVGGAVSFEIILHESNSTIEVHYLDTIFGALGYDFGESASIGVQDWVQNNTYGLEYACDTPGALSDGLAIRFLPPCDYSFGLVGGVWRMISLPCISGGTVNDVFGDDGLGVYGVDWAMFERDELTDSYRQLLLTDLLLQGSGYWIEVRGQSPSPNVTGALSDTGIDFPIPLVFDVAPGRWNMLGHPFSFAVDWANVMVQDNGTLFIYPMSDINAGNYVTNRTMYVWIGSSYQSYHPVSNPGSLNIFDGFWVRGVGDGTLLIPPGGGQPPVEGASYQWGPGEWWVQLPVHSGEMTDPGNRLGRLAVAGDGLDEYDLEELRPFASPYLTLVLPHADWISSRWSSTTDFRQTRPGSGGSWDLELRSDVPRQVTIGWATGGDSDGILERSRLVDVEHGVTIQPAVEASYTTTMVGTSHRLLWQVNSMPVVDAGPALAAPVGEPVGLKARFSDEDQEDVHSAVITWGDGTSQQGTVNGAAGTVSGSHLYQAAGTFTVKVCVEDQRGGKGCDSTVVNVYEGACWIFGDTFESGNTSAWSGSS
jgi:hypothetical protein